MPPGGSKITDWPEKAPNLADHIRLALRNRKRATFYRRLLRLVTLMISGGSYRRFRNPSHSPRSIICTALTRSGWNIAMNTEICRRRIKSTRLHAQQT